MDHREGMVTGRGCIRKITENNVSVGKESYAGLGLDTAVGVGEDKTDTRNIQEANQET